MCGLALKRVYAGLVEDLSVTQIAFSVIALSFLIMVQAGQNMIIDIFYLLYLLRLLRIIRDSHTFLLIKVY